ncbi:hypothetical protein M8J75_000060 [Diaphorina citri]|nr:hypothetical protein M8J75_000060 [Diaphorina citri]
MLLLVLVLSQTGCGALGLILDKAVDGLESVLLDCYQNPKSDGSCPFDDITFWLYTRGELNGIQITEENMVSLPIDQDQPWKIIYHGYGCNKDLTPGPELKAAYLSRGAYNLLILDVGGPFMFNKTYLCYPRAAIDSLDLVGKCTAALLLRLREAGVLPPLDALHFIGHSLGAHAAAEACGILNARGIGKVRRLTGLDPAGPFFHRNYTRPGRVISPEDATYVDVYHTNGGDQLLQFGTRDRRGVVDVRFNGGGSQPGCNDTSCNHARAVEYFAESINPKAPEYRVFLGHPVDTTQPNTILVGEYISFEVRGEIAVSTNAQSPYAQN